MKWTRADKYSEVSECGRYAISAAFNGTEWIFSAWNRGKVPELHTGSSAECKEACRRHRDGLAD